MGRKRLRGAVSSPLVSTTYQRQGNTIPTSDRIPANVGKRDIMYEHKWRKDAQEKTETIQEIYRKASRIAPAYNKGSLQYLPSDFDKLESKKRT